MGKKRHREPATPARKIPHLVDAHTHLASCGARSPEEVKAFVDRARAAGVERICTVGDGLEECEYALQASRIPGVFAACALHPTRANELDTATKQRLVEMADDPRVVAIGETGLDTYWIGRSDTCAPLETQLEAFAWHVELAVKTGKALMIHNREADQELMDLLGRLERPREVMLHCFSSPLDVAELALERGYVLSFTGNVTYPANEHLRTAAAMAPAGQLLIETDAPFMTPMPFRGQKNEPSYIGHTALAIAAARRQPVEELANEVSATFDRVFGLTPGAQ